MNLDYLIRNCHIIDGTGASAVPGCIGIKDGRVVLTIEKNTSAEQVIDARGQVVCPGFIDMHSHTDAGLLIDPRAQSKITQGITLEVCGQCGFSAAPVLDEAGRAELDDWRKRYDIKHNWTTVDDFLRVLESTPIAINFVTFVGHSNLRAAAVGLEDREATPDEIDKMRMLAAEALNQGAFGLSTGLQYPPSSFANTDELVQIAAACTPLGGIYASHTRDEREGLAESDAEAIEIGERGGVAVQISHHKGYGEGKLERTLAALELIRQARRRGLDVTVDVYPYTASSTGLGIFLPRWAHDGGDQAFVERLKSHRNELLTALKASSAQGCPKWHSVLVSNLKTEANREYIGLTIAEIADRRGKSAEETVLDLLTEESGSVSIIHFGQAEEDVVAVMSAEFSMFGTDASARSTTGELAKGKPHPRAFGTFPRILGRYVRERKILSLELAVHKMTFMPARKLRLSDRGVIKNGYWADLLVFDPNTVIDTATYQNPHQICRGINYVFVNGRLAVDHGELTGAFAGRVIRRGAK